MKPAVSTHRLASELKYKVAVMICAERQPYVHEVDMILSAVIRRTYSVPNCQDIRMDNRMRFLSRGNKPKISIVSGIDNGTSTNYLLALNSYINTPVITFGKFQKEFHRGDVAMQFEPIIIL